MKKLLLLFTLCFSAIAFGQTYGPNLVTNGDFSQSGDWGFQNSSITNGVGQIVVPASGSTSSSISQGITYEAGKTYRLKLKINAPAGTFFRAFDNYGNIGGLALPAAQKEATGSLTEFTFEWVANVNSNSIVISRGTNDITIIVDDVEINEVNPATPPTPDPEPNSIIYTLPATVGDGATDDTQALQDWIDIKGAKHYLPKGTYKVTSAISSTIATGSVTIISHPEAKIVPTSGFPDFESIFFIKNAKEVFIDGVYIDASNLNPSNYDTETYGIRIEDADNVTVQNSNLFKMSKGGVHVVDSKNVRLLNNDILETRNYAIWVKDSEDVLADGNIVSGDGLNQKDRWLTGNTLGQTPGILFSGSERVKAVNNFINNFRNTGTKTEGCNYVLYSGNTVIDVGKDAIKIMGQDSVSTVKYAKVVNNTTEFLNKWEPDGNDYIQLWNTEDFVIEGNIIKGGKKEVETGIHVYATAPGFITKNGIIANNTMNTLGSHGVYITTASDITISGNRIKDYGEININGRGIWAEDVERIQISSNTMEIDTLPSSGFSQGIFIVGSNSSIFDNTIKNVRNVGIYSKIHNSSNFEITGNTIVDAGDEGIYIAIAQAAIAKSIKVNGNNIIESGGYPFALSTLDANSFVPSISYENNQASSLNNAYGSQLPGGASWLKLDGWGTIEKLNYTGEIVSGDTNSFPRFFNKVPNLIQRGEGNFVITSGTPNFVASSGSTCIGVQATNDTTGEQFGYWVRELGVWVEK